MAWGAHLVCSWSRLSTHKTRRPPAGVEGAAGGAKSVLEAFTAEVQQLGPSGYAMYVGTYALLELFLLPATPVALAAAPLFGLPLGLALSVAGGLAGATAQFWLGRTVARARVAAWAQQFPPFRALDRALAKDGFRVVALVNLSPAASLANLLNYSYGTTTLELRTFVAATAVSIVPRTFATVQVRCRACPSSARGRRRPAWRAAVLSRARALQAGALGGDVLGGEGDANPLGVFALVAAVAATLYVTKVAKEALDEIQEDS